MAGEKVFVSSTWIDNAERRKRVEEAILDAGMVPVGMERFTASTRTTVEECLRMAEEADILVGVVAWRYGWIPPGEERSITEMEYDAASQRLMFVLDPDVPIHPERDLDEGPERGEKIEKLDNFKQRFSAEQMPALFKEENLSLKINRALENWRRQERIPCGSQRVAGLLKPAYAQHFRGRESQLDQLRHRLADPDVRLLVVCGRAGAGKTTLVTKCLLELDGKERSSSSAAGRAVAGVVFVDLKQPQHRTLGYVVQLVSSVLDPDLARELQERWAASLPLADKIVFLLCRALGTRRYIVVLDNLELLLAEDGRVDPSYADLARLIEACVEYDHGVRLIATSRRAVILGHGLEGRSGSRRCEIPLDDGLQSSDAVELLRDLDPDGRKGLREAPDETLGEIARRCYGHPRTLEILAGLLSEHPILTPKRLLDDRTQLERLADHPADELYSKLDSTGQAVMQVLAVFDRPVPRSAVRVLLPGDADRQTLDRSLSRLVRDHVIDLNAGRFSLHPLDQQYAYSRIPDEPPERFRATLHRRAAEHFRSLSKPESEWSSIADLELQLAEFDQLVRAERFDDACRLLNQFDREYLSLWGHQATIIQCRTRLLGRLAERSLEEVNFGHLGSAYMETGDGAKGLEFTRRALEIAQELGDGQGETSRWTGNLAVAYKVSGQKDRVDEYLQKALDIAIERGDLLHQGRWRSKIASQALDAGNLDEAVEQYRSALDASRATSDRRFERISLIGLGAALVARDDLDGAIACYEEAAGVARRINDVNGEYLSLHALADCHGRRDDGEAQRRYLAEAVEIARRAGDRAREGASLARLAEFERRRGNYERCIELYEKAAEIAREVGDRTANVVFLDTLARLSIAIERPAKARLLYEQALEVVRMSRDAETENEVLISLGMTANLLQDLQSAISYYEEALAVARRIENEEKEVIALFNLGDAHHILGELKLAENYYVEALSRGDSFVDFKCTLGLALLYRLEGRTKRAQRDFKRCVGICRRKLKTEPTHYHAYALVLGLLGLGEGDEALQALEEAIAMNGSRQAILFAIQDVELYQRGQPASESVDKVVERLEEALAGASL